MSSVAARPRLAIVVSHPTQYYSPWFRALADSGLFQLRVFYLWKFGVTPQHDPRFGITLQWDVDLLSGYDLEFVKNYSLRPGAESFWGFINLSLHRTLRAWRPQAILLFGYNHLTHFRLMRWASRRKVPLIFRGDSHFLGRAVPVGWRRAVLRWVYQHFAAVTYVGRANREYFIACGVPEKKLFFTPHAVDGPRFTRTDTVVIEAARRREALNIPPGAPVVLFAGKFVRAKQPLALLKAFLTLHHPEAVLVFVGDGPEKETLTREARDNIERNVRICPFANQSEMPAVYAMANIFVLPSQGLYETWGLAVNESMMIGTPCLVSDRVGCQQDLVTDGETGWVFRAEDLQNFQAKLNEALAAVRADRDAWSQRAQVRVERFSYAAATHGLREAVTFVLTGADHLNPSRLDRASRP